MSASKSSAQCNNPIDCEDSGRDFQRFHFSGDPSLHLSMSVSTSSAESKNPSVPANQIETHQSMSTIPIDYEDSGRDFQRFHFCDERQNLLFPARQTPLDGLPPNDRNRRRGHGGMGGGAGRATHRGRRGGGGADAAAGLIITATRKREGMEGGRGRERHEAGERGVMGHRECTRSV